MPIDYEAEYNNRARVPEHPEIFARWTREAEDYRAEAMKERRAELGLSYGSSPRQFIDLFSPRPDVTSPLALFIHGGYWRSLDPSMSSHMARGLNAHGVAVGVVGYDLAPEVTIAEIIEQIRHACLFMWLRTGQRMMVYGHSAGGHLAAAMVATEWHELYPKTPEDLVPARSPACSISRHSFRSPWRRICDSTRPRRGGSHRCSGRHRRAASSMRWPEARNRASSCARAGSSPRPGARLARRPASRPSPGQTISLRSTRCPIPKARWLAGSSSWRRRVRTSSARQRRPSAARP